MLRSIVLISIFAVPAFADAPCGPRDGIVENLATKYGETRQGIGLANVGVFEIFAGPEGTWTIALTYPDGRMCLMASGTDYSNLSEAPGVVR